MKKVIPFILLITAFLSAEYTDEYPELSKECKEIIVSHLGEKEGYEVNTQFEVSVRAYPNPVRIIQWTLQGGTYWANYLTIVDESSGVKEVDTKLIYGLVDYVIIEEGFIRIDGKEPLPTDPICCPSKQTYRYFEIANNKLNQLE